MDRMLQYGSERPPGRRTLEQNSLIGVRGPPMNIHTHFMLPFKNCRRERQLWALLLISGVGFKFF